jgi:hypothetical protein
MMEAVIPNHKQIMELGISPVVSDAPSFKQEDENEKNMADTINDIVKWAAANPEEVWKI